MKDNSVNSSFFFDKQRKKGESKDTGKIKSFITRRLQDPPKAASLFDEEEILGREEAIRNAQETGIEYMDKRYTNSATRTLYGYSYVISQDDGEDIREFEKSSINKEGKGTYIEIPRSQYITRRIPIGEFCHTLFKDRRTTHIKMIIRDTFQLSATNVAWIYKDKDNKRRMKIAPILHCEYDFPLSDIDEALKAKYGTRTTEGEVTTAWNKFLFYSEKSKYTISEKEQDIIDLIIETIKKQGYINITFGRPFFQGLSFSYVPELLLTEWGKDGTKGEIFPLLLNHLQTLRPIFLRTAKKARNRVFGEAKKDKLTPEQREAALAEAEVKALTGDILLQTINDRLETDYFVNREYTKLKELVDSAMKFCQDKIGLISKYWYSGKGKNIKLHYTFNKTYGKKEGLPDPDDDIEDVEAEEV